MGRCPFIRGSIVAAVSMAIYLAIVVLTTPNLPPLVSLGTTVKVNALFMATLASALWVQGFLQARLRSIKACRINETATNGAVSIGTSISSFVSFLSLTHVGCCGFWLYLLSLIAGSGGAGVAFVGAVIGSSGVFMWGGAGSVWALNLYLYIRMRRSMEGQRPRSPRSWRAPTHRQ